ncbi:putative Zn(II)2Cys6 transcription factor [Aspergillus mulundensis]|uniref:Putative Zn(II)2Cys6 transcription factor n=1 Tax=Aspergillus mulundensis TaxID=1810919 RepID=A0A3D8R4N7_9EURO|nr:putative Zn(II)2Cys6 transcription factor [Aspergillus mulundensis]RDW68891.1 putative Zn(II)2Cys6 transcription factor [Aspergillus mulundensis]
MACNTCRQRKVKCDAEYPKCRNCRVRNQACITTDPQRPGCPGVREWLEVLEKDKERTQFGALREDSNEKTNGTDAPSQEEAGLAVAPSSSLEQERADVEENEPSPVRQPFETSVNAEQGTNRTKTLGGSSSQCLAKSLDVYFKAARMEPVSDFFRHGMRRAVELDIPLTLSLPDLPDRERRARYLEVYHSRIDPLYPIFDWPALTRGVEHLAGVSNLAAISRDEIPFLVCAYLIMALGMDEAAQCPTEEGERYLHAAASLLGHTIVVPYQPTVQALILFTVAYRGRNQEGLGWQTLGIAIRIACTLGMHRSSKLPTNLVRTRIWATCCSLEKVMQIASGWPTVITDDLIAQPDSLDGLEHRFLQWHLGLANYQGSISQHLYTYRPYKTSSSSSKSQQDTRATVRQILLDTARLDRGLLSWANNIPLDMRPGSDLITSSADFHILAFLSIEYHGTLIALHRAALIAPRSMIEEEVTRHCPDDPSRHRLSNGEAICANSARAIAKLSIELAERGADSVLIPAGTAGLACIALAIWLMKHPSSRLRDMDLQLLKGCLTYASTRWAQCGFDAKFLEGLGAVYEQVRRRLESTHAAALDGTPKVCHGYVDPSASGKPETPRYTAENLPTPLTSGYAAGTPIQHNPGHSYHHPSEATPTLAHKATPTSSCFNSTYSGHGLLNRNNGQNGQHTNWSQPQPMHSSDLGTNAITHGFLDGIADAETTLGGLTSFDETFPFEGLNVEELWNWMLYFDSPPRTDTL